MDTKKHPKKDAKNAQAEENPGNIDKVRDLLFGGQMRDYDRRFTRFEERLVQESTELKEDVRKRLLALEQFVKQETASLAAAAKELSREVRDNAKATEKKTGQIDAQVEKLQGELRKQILDLHKRVTDDIRGKIDDVLARLSQEASDLRHDKADRATIAALLNEMALRLSSDQPAPGADNGRKG